MCKVSCSAYTTSTSIEILIYKAECNVMSHSVSPIHVGHIHVSSTDYYY